MKLAILFVFCILSSSYASYLPGPVVSAPALVNTGSSAQYRSQDNLGNYEFGYKEKHSTGGTFRREKGDSYGTKVGSYGLSDADGRIRIVNYVADAAGFRVAVASNEPGLTPQLHQAATINKPILPVVAAVAPLAHVESIAAPSYVHHEPLISSHPGPVGHINAGPIGLNSAYPAASISTGIAGSPAYIPNGLHGYQGLLAAPATHYGGSHYVAYPIRR